MAVGDLITAARYNNLQSRIATVMGSGSGTEGYGQQLESTQVLSNDVIRASHLNDLYVDLIKAKVHQEGVDNYNIATVKANINLIADEESKVTSETGVVSSDPDGLGANKGVADFEGLMLDIENNRFLVDVTQASLEAGLTSSRTTAWNGKIQHVFVAQFPDFDRRRFFFNAGGEIRLNFNLSSGSTAKALDWRLILSNVGVVKFNWDSTIATGTGTGSGIGAYDLTPTNQMIYQKIGSNQPGIYGTTYAENTITIYAREKSVSEIEFTVEFFDQDSGDPNIDENVDGSLSSIIQSYRPTGPYVEVLGPSYYDVITLGSAPVAPPISPPTPTDEGAIQISVIDESSEDAAVLRNNYLSWRANWAGRKLYVLQPTGQPASALKLPTEFNNDPLAYGPITVARDNGDVTQISDWFNIASLGTVPVGTYVSIAVDNSGSTTLDQVKASYDLFVQNCANAGLNLTVLTMTGENWVTPHDRAL